MHHTNHYYGHAHLMARYAGLADWRHPPRVWGYLQHGWNVHHGFDPTAELVPGVPKLVWSDGPREVGRALGIDGYAVVGAPWGYLLRLEPDFGGTRREGTIYYPFHGWERQRVVGDHAGLAATIRARETDPVTVCLYWLEYRDRAVRRTYERAGFRVITHGPRGGRRRGTDPRFLDRQLAELRRHRRVASNRLSTAVLYGASVGCEVGVYGDPMRLVDDDLVPGGADRIRREWPELHDHTVPQAIAEKVARQELGLDRLLGPTEVVDAFGWQTSRIGDRGQGGVAGERDEGPATVETLRAQVRWLDEAVQERDLELRRTRESTSYRLGNAIVRPLGAARRLRDRGRQR